jgi:hypothetical protein
MVKEANICLASGWSFRPSGKKLIEGQGRISWAEKSLIEDERMMMNEKRQQDWSLH